MKNWLSTEQAAARLGITPGRVRTLCRTGKLKATLWRRWQWRIEESALAVFQQHERKSGRPPKPNNSESAGEAKAGL